MLKPVRIVDARIDRFQRWSQPSEATVQQQCEAYRVEHAIGASGTGHEAQVQTHIQTTVGQPLNPENLRYRRQSLHPQGAFNNRPNRPASGSDASHLFCAFRFREHDAADPGALGAEC
ncbi:hypothetical protein D3C86_1838380 [compost metagenome]